MTAAKREGQASPHTATKRRRPRAPRVPGVSYRQLDWWAKKGLLTPGREKPGKTGTGNFRVWTAEELRVAEDIGRLRAVDVELRTAARIARRGRAAVDAALAALASAGGGQ